MSEVANEATGVHGMRGTRPARVMLPLLLLLGLASPLAAQPAAAPGEPLVVAPAAAAQEAARSLAALEAEASRLGAEAAKAAHADPDNAERLIADWYRQALDLTSDETSPTANASSTGWSRASGRALTRADRFVSGGSAGHPAPDRGAGERQQDAR
jgi:hypothetical protein